MASDNVLSVMLLGHLVHLVHDALPEDALHDLAVGFLGNVPGQTALLGR